MQEIELWVLSGRMKKNIVSYLAEYITAVLKAKCYKTKNIK